MSLREDCASAAKDIFEKFHKDGEVPDYAGYSDMIEALVRAFATKALRQVVYANEHPNMPGLFLAGARIQPKDGLWGLGYSTMAQAADHADFAVESAISAAAGEK